MPENEHLNPMLDAYVKLSNPRYAILIDAPWGAGKTHAIGEWLKTHPKHLKVSVYGLSSSQQIRDAIVREMISGKDVQVSTSAVSTFEGVLKKFTGAQIDLTNIYQDAILKKLTRTSDL